MVLMQHTTAPCENQFASVRQTGTLRPYQIVQVQQHDAYTGQGLLKDQYLRYAALDPQLVERTALSAGEERRFAGPNR